MTLGQRGPRLAREAHRAGHNHGGRRWMMTRRRSSAGHGLVRSELLRTEAAAAFWWNIRFARAHFDAERQGPSCRAWSVVQRTSYGFSPDVDVTAEPRRDLRQRREDPTVGGAPTEEKIRGLIA